MNRESINAQKATGQHGQFGPLQRDTPSSATIPSVGRTLGEEIEFNIGHIDAEVEYPDPHTGEPIIERVPVEYVVEQIGARIEESGVSRTDVASEFGFLRAETDSDGYREILTRVQNMLADRGFSRPA